MSIQKVPTDKGNIFNPFHTGHFHPLTAQTNFSFQRCCNLNDNCAVMQHCTRIKILCFYPPKKSFRLVVFGLLCGFYLLRYKQKKSGPDSGTTCPFLTEAQCTVLTLRLRKFPALRLIYGAVAP